MKAILCVVITLFFVSTTAVFAQTTVELAPNTNYQTRGTAGITIDGSRYRITARTDTLPTTIPNNGRYYILWATIEDGRADNLGTISNGQELTTTVVGRPTQIFITAEKERFPEFVQGPRISQSRTLTQAETGTLPSPTPSGSTLPVGGANVGQPTDAPETGYGGSLIFYTLTAAMIVFGTFGFLRSLKPSSQK